MGHDDGRSNFNEVAGNTGDVLEGTQIMKIRQKVDCGIYQETPPNCVGYVAPPEPCLAPFSHQS